MICALLIHNKKISRDGFTLIEVAIVMFIIVMLTTAATPLMKNFAESTKLRSASRSIRNLMEFAKNSAISERKNYAVVFDRSNSSYWLTLEEYIGGSSLGTVSDIINYMSQSSSTNEQTNDLSNLPGSTKETKNSLQDSETEQSVASRTGSILGIPKELPEGIEIALMNAYSTYSSSSYQRVSSSNSDVQYVVFYPDGTAENFELYLQGISGKTFLISVTGSTGLVSIRELSNEELDKLGISKKVTS